MSRKGKDGGRLGYSATTVYRRQLKNKTKPLQKPQSWDALLEKAQQDLDRNKREIG